MSLLHAETRVGPLASAWRRGDWLGPAHGVLLTGFLLLSFVGTAPFAERSLAERVEGSPLDRIVVLGLLALACAILWRRRAAAWRCLGENRLLFLTIGFCQMSVLWSRFPDLSLRRALLMLFLTVAAAGVAVGVGRLRQFHGALFFTLVLIIAFNLLGTALWPAQAISDIGVKGLYTQKNVAGMVSMITIVLGAAWTMAASTASARLAGLAGLGLTALFLALTQSKTSIGLTVVGLGAGGLFYVAQRLGRGFAMLVLSFGLFALAAFAALVAANDFDAVKILSLAVADTSFTGRDELWAFAWRSGMEHFWLGHGYGGFWDVGAANDPLARQEIGTWLGDVDKGTINQAHNGYLELWVNIGLPATLAATATVAAGLAASTRQAIAGPSEPGERAAYAGIALILLLYLLHNLTEATLLMRGAPFANLSLLLLMLASRRDLRGGRG